MAKDVLMHKHKLKLMKLENLSFIQGLFKLFKQENCSNLFLRSAILFIDAAKAELDKKDNNFFYLTFSFEEDKKKIIFVYSKEGKTLSAYFYKSQPSLNLSVFGFSQNTIDISSEKVTVFLRSDLIWDTSGEIISAAGYNLICAIESFVSGNRNQFVFTCSDELVLKYLRENSYARRLP